MDFELDTPSTSDLISCGSLDLNGQQFSDFDFTWSGNFGRGNYDLIEAGSVSGSLGSSTSGTIDGYTATLAVQGNNDLVLIVTPEPSTLALLAAGRHRTCRLWIATAKKLAAGTGTDGLQP